MCEINQKQMVTSDQDRYQDYIAQIDYNFAYVQKY